MGTEKQGKNVFEKNVLTVKDSVCGNFFFFFNEMLENSFRGREVTSEFILVFIMGFSTTGHSGVSLWKCIYN